MRNLVAIVCFFLSGTAGLVYEVAWIREASLVFGSTTFAISSVLAVFFLGLACGSYLFGRIGTRVSQPLKHYAKLEIPLGLYAVASLFIFDIAHYIYGAWYRDLGDHTGLLFVARFALVTIIILPPTILMGGTLPLFCRQYVISRDSIARSVGFLYGVNTLGAAAGCALAGFLLLPVLGLTRTVWVGASL
ncbi:MAG: spermidine synthase, partial [Planctomycetes bacterium]|nr:spermidine synthase [Planctomycetota bacterium]